MKHGILKTLYIITIVGGISSGIVFGASYAKTVLPPVKYVNVSCDTKYGKLEFSSVNPVQKNSKCKEVSEGQ